MEINNNIEEGYCSLEVSKLLKEREFKVPTFRLYGGDGIKLNVVVEENLHVNNPLSSWVSRPTHAVAIEWLRINFRMWICVDFENYSNTWFYTISNITNKTEEIFGNYNSPQEATEAALLQTLQKL